MRREATEVGRRSQTVREPAIEDVKMIGDSGLLIVGLQDSPLSPHRLNRNVNLTPLRETDAAGATSLIAFDFRITYLQS